MTPCMSNPDMWFSEEIFDVKAAKRICKQDCSPQARNRCLEVGMQEDYGVWGGLSTYERIKLRRGAA